MKLRYTQYFLRRKEHPSRKNIKYQWLKYVVENPVKEHLQQDGRIVRWAKIEEANNKYLRVVLLKDGFTIHNAMFDQKFRR